MRELLRGLLVVLARGGLVGDGPGERALEDVLFFLGDVVEDFGGEVEVLGEDGARGVVEPVGEEEGALLGKVAVVKDEEELGAVLAEALEGVRDAAGEVPAESQRRRAWKARSNAPEITLVDVVDEAAAFVVEGRDADGPVEDISPLGFLVPVQLADDTLA